MIRMSVRICWAEALQVGLLVVFLPLCIVFFISELEGGRKNDLA